MRFEAIQISAEIFFHQPEADDPVICFDKQDALLIPDDAGVPARLPRWREAAAKLPPEREYCCLGKLDGKRCFAVKSDLASVAPDGMVKFTCRQVLLSADEAIKSALCRGKKLLTWAASHRFCGACRSELTASETDLALICPTCGEHYYPQLAPAVIVAVTRNNGTELLLAHNRNFRNNMYSLIAGFVEAGETVEAAAAREIMEECGLKVKNIRYFTSQVWPFPNSLMLAFTAEYDSGTAVPDGAELSDLGWFTAENHPELPSPGSVARKVIDHIFNWDSQRH